MRATRKDASLWQIKRAPIVHQSTMVQLVPSELGKWPLTDGQLEPALLRMIVASNARSRESAYRLAYDTYRRAGLVGERSDRLIVEPYDGEPETLTLIIAAESGDPLGSLTVAIDGPAGLPCDELYRDETAALRAEGGRLVEFTRLVLADPAKGRGLPVLHLMNFAQVYARLVCRCTDLVIEINPRHAAYYRHKWLFEPAGPERACARVEGAPAILLRLPLGRYTTAEERKIAEFLRTSHRPMDRDELAYFDIDWRTVCWPASESRVLAF